MDRYIELRQTDAETTSQQTPPPGFSREQEPEIHELYLKQDLIFQSGEDQGLGEADSHPIQALQLG